MRALLVLLALASPAMGQELTAPSGLKMVLYDVILDEEIPLVRFRFEVPEIAENALSFTAVSDDMQAVCDQSLLPGLKQSGWENGQIVMQLSAQQVDFGATVPGITQYFQPFSIGPDTCIWEDN